MLTQWVCLSRHFPLFLLFTQSRTLLLLDRISMMTRRWEINKSREYLEQLPLLLLLPTDIELEDQSICLIARWIMLRISYQWWINWEIITINHTQVSLRHWMCCSSSTPSTNLIVLPQLSDIFPVLVLMSTQPLLVPQPLSMDPNTEVLMRLSWECSRELEANPTSHNS